MHANAVSAGEITYVQTWIMAPGPKKKIRD